MPVAEVEAPVPLRVLVRGDPVLRRLLTVTLVDTVGRGAFFTLTSLYLTTIAGVPAVAVGLGLTIAGGVGVLSSLAFGHLADRWSSRMMLVVLHVVQGLAVAAYVLVHDVVSLVVVASIVTLVQQGGSSVRSAAVGRAFPGEERVRIRATMRTVTNIGISAGTAVAAIPLAIGTGTAYRITLAAGGAFYLVSAVLLLGLPAARVDARARTAASPVEPGPSPYRDLRFLGVTALSGVFGIQFGLAEVGVPLWVVGHTRAPDVLVSALLLVNTGLVIALQVRLSRGTGDLRGAGRAMSRAGWLMAAACVVFAAAGWGSPLLATVALLVAAVLQAFAEILSSAAGWNLSFELAPPDRLGAYQGIYGTGYALGAMVAPAVVTLTAIDLGTPGWLILAVMFLASAAGLAAIARRAAVSKASVQP
ncbi:MFS transporter [Winogradskya humida]|uniref:MFS transporter n=1 Tax=Winogradskya humida TaxID=113566 RepID=A0ABQ3ZGU4_9ACTN|nr:MFS transporter [Actinoplanes humidus]GIE17788.1 MFS transporter [Actinoplanes humidus]